MATTGEAEHAMLPRRPGALSAADAEGGTRGVLALPRRPHPGRTVPLLSL
ncbi:hypothetical protein LO771_14360 [Streptacidiphilus sp. ASG 303]|nr:hypothetical protein [Streptacidiphilus sp. ASG 303]MCD0483545.1 hypothetical protein [Streptacidiphilus sp. ASG 303]